MIGNDVVDLLDPDADPETHDVRFDARVFREAERDALTASEDPAALRWSLWAAKEAAYKLCVRRDPATIFSPILFEVSLRSGKLHRRNARVEGVVEHRGERLTLQLRLDDDWVHAVVSDSNPAPGSRLVFGAQRLSRGPLAQIAPERLAAEARRLAVCELAPRLGVSASLLEVRKQGRLPLLARSDAGPDDAPLPPLSLSHHGAVVGFASWLPGASALRAALSTRHTAERVAL